MGGTSLHTSTTERGADKLLAIGVYGESVAAYRYAVLAEKAPDDKYRREFANMADEEQSHKQRLQKLLADMYPDADFIITQEEKDLVVTGPRLLEIRDRVAFNDAMKMILETEKKTSRFYAHHEKRVTHPVLRDLFHELAEEGVEHYQRLRALVENTGIPDIPRDD